MAGFGVFDHPALSSFLSIVQLAHFRLRDLLFNESGLMFNSSDTSRDNFCPFANSLPAPL